MLTINAVSKRYGKQEVLNKVSLKIADGECVSLVGESGSGKSTLGRLILGLERPSLGAIYWNDKNIRKMEKKDLFRTIQPVFQDNTGCFNPRVKVIESLIEPMKYLLHIKKEQRDGKARNLLEAVGLPEDIGERFPHELSGGERKRICIARAISIQPKLVLLDEAVTGLDATIMITILDLLKELQKSIGCAYLFITHDLRAALYMSQKIAVMKNGEIVETASKLRSLSDFTHPYSKSLWEAETINKLKSGGKNEETCE